MITGEIRIDIFNEKDQRRILDEISSQAKIDSKNGGVVVFSAEPKVVTQIILKIESMKLEPNNRIRK